MTLADTLGNSATSPIVSGNVAYGPTALSYASLGTVTDNVTMTPVSPVSSGLISPVTYAASGNAPSGLTVDPGAGTISGTPQTRAGTYTFSVTATVSIGNTAITSVPVTVAYPAASLAYSAVSPTTVGVPVVATAPSVLGLYGTPTYSVSSGTLPKGLTLDPTAGFIAGVPAAPSSFSFAVTATDSRGNHATSSAITGSMTYGIASLSYPDASTAFDGSALSASPVTSGFYGNISYARKGTLPSGLSLNTSSGVISGTPEVPSGTYSFSVTATDGYANTATASVATAVAYPNASLSYSGFSSNKQRVSFSATATESGLYGSPTYAVSSGTLPSGLTLSASSGAISGAPVYSGSFAFAVTATDSTHNTATDTVTGNIAPGTAAVSYSTFSGLAAGTAFSASPTILGFTAPTTYVVLSGSLPPGLSIAAFTGIISGTPSTAAAYSFAVTATDGFGDTASTALSGSVGYANATLSYAFPASVTDGSAVSVAASTTKLITPVVFSGSMPGRLTLNTSTGAITGTPEIVAGSFSFTVTAVGHVGMECPPKLRHENRAHCS